MFIDIVFDGPPSHNSGRFVEVENEKGASINAGEWIDRGDGLWALRIGISPSGWEPIATAPQDGTWILVHHFRWEFPDIAGWNGRCWKSYSEVIAVPTHWQALPAPPVEKD